MEIHLKSKIDYKTMKKYYITTAIDYANGSPHLGHAYEKVLSDVIARIKRLMGYDVFFLTGLDEHGQKVLDTASSNNLSAINFCDKIYKKFHSMIEKLSISNNFYLRTTNIQHKKIVTKILNKFYQEGKIYKAKYSGFYSVKEERFVKISEQIDGKWPKELGSIIKIEEYNYFLKIKMYQKWLIKFIKNSNYIYPEIKTKQVISFLEKESLNDLCISRPKERLTWGIELPFDKNYVAYVWFDALLSYLSPIYDQNLNLNKYWPPDCQVIGKDILIPSHAIYFPIIQKALNIPISQKLVVHGWWLLKGEKMSKSNFNQIDPINIIEEFGPDSLRYFLIQKTNWTKDNNFSLNLIKKYHNAYLVNNIGNLINRTLIMIYKYCNSIIPNNQLLLSNNNLEKSLINKWNQTSKLFVQFTHDFNFQKSIEEWNSFISYINKYLEQRKPWILFQSNCMKDKEIAKSIIAHIYEAIRLANNLIYPIMPEFYKKLNIIFQFNSITIWKDNLIWRSYQTLDNKKIIFPFPLLFDKKI